MTEAQVTLELPSGRPVVIGRDHYPGYAPIDVDVVSDPGGFATATFTLRRPRSSYNVPQPDLQAWTPATIDEEGTRTFEGRIMEAPIQPDDLSIAVQGRGWQYNLDDDPLERLWVHETLADYRDTRTLLATDLGAWKLSGTAEAGDGGIVIGWPKNTQADANQHIGVTYDAGADSTVKRVAVDLEPIGGANSYTFLVRGHSIENPNPPAGSYEDILSADHATMAAGFAAANFTGAWRYITLLMFRDDGTSAVTTEDRLVRVRAARLFRQAAYASGNDSVLKASTIISDALDQAPEISTDRSGITVPALPLRHFATSAPATPRELVQAANAFHNYRFKIGRNRRPIYGPYPTQPRWQLTAEAARRLTNASDISAEPMFNVVQVEATDHAGRPLRIRRYAAQLPEAVQGPTSDVTHPNPGFETNATGWTALDGTFGRSTTNPRTGTGCGVSDGSASSSVFTSAFAGTWRKGKTYRVRIWLRPSGVAGAWINANPAFWIGMAAGGIDLVVAIPGSALTDGAYTPIDLWIRPKVDGTTGTLQLKHVPAAGFTANFRIDDLEIAEAAFGLLDRRGYTRVFRRQIGFPIDATTAEAIADADLRTKVRAPFKTEIDIQPGDLATYPEGRNAHPRLLVGEEGELLHFPGLYDPDNRRRGRDGAIAQVQYSAGRARTQIDNQRDNLEALLARYALVTGQG